MGLSCLIFNDIEYDVWIIYGVNWMVFLVLVGGVLVLFLGGVGFVVFGVFVGVGGVFFGGGVWIMVEEGIRMGVIVVIIVGLIVKIWILVGVVILFSVGVVVIILGIIRE